MILNFFDTETTDLISNSARRIEKQPKIIEFYATRIRQTGEGKDAQFEFADELNLLLAHPAPLKAKTTEITGLTNEDLKDAPPFHLKAKEIKEYMEGADVVVAHNLSYDMAVTDIEILRSDIGPISWPEPLCTVEATQHIFQYRLSLSALHEYLFGEKFEGAHRAKVDVEAMVRCYQELVKRDMI